jgi:hypothetical protein
MEVKIGDTIYIDSQLFKKGQVKGGITTISEIIPNRYGNDHGIKVTACPTNITFNLSVLIRNQDHYKKTFDNIEAKYTEF